MIIELLIVAVPDEAPMFRVVAAPAKLTVVALAFISAKLDEAVVSEVVISGDVPNTTRPLPVSSESVAAKAAEFCEVVRLPEASVVTNLEAVKPVVMVPETFKLAMPETLFESSIKTPEF